MSTKIPFLAALLLLEITSITFAQDCFDAGDCWIKAGQRGNSLEAISFYDKAEALFTADSDTALLYNIYSGRGNVYHTLKEETKALQDYNKLIQLRPKDKMILAVAYTSRGNVMSSAGNEKGAIASFTKSIQTYPPNMIALTNRIYAYFRTEQRDLAMADLKLWAELGSGRALDLLKGEFQVDWTEEQKKALELDMQWQGIEKEKQMAQNLIAEKKYEEAVAQYVKVFDLYGERKDAEAKAVVATDIANLKNTIQDYEGGASWASMVVYGSYSNSAAYAELFLAHYKLGDMQSAIGVSYKALEKYPQGPRVQRYGNWMYSTEANKSYTAEDYPKAYENYYSAYEFKRTDIDAIKYAGHSAYKATGYKEALNCYSIALQANPSLQEELQPFIDYCQSQLN